MSILDKALVTNTHMRGMSDFERSVVLSSDVKPTGEWKPGGFQPIEQHELFVKIGIRFWSNEVMFNESLKTARKTLLSRLYENQLMWLQELQSAVMNGDSRACLGIINKMRDEIGM